MGLSFPFGKNSTGPVLRRHKGHCVGTEPWVPWVSEVRQMGKWWLHMMGDPKWWWPHIWPHIELPIYIYLYMMGWWLINPQHLPWFLTILPTFGMIFKKPFHHLPSFCHAFWILSQHVRWIWAFWCQAICQVWEVLRWCSRRVTAGSRVNVQKQSPVSCVYCL